MAVADRQRRVEMPQRWTVLRSHPVQQRLLASSARFKVIEAGRRSGKTELAKRDGVLDAIRPHPERPGYFVGYFAPTRDQAKEIYWDDLKQLSRPWWLKEPSETDLRIWLLSGAQIRVVGMDKPSRVEGRPIDRAYVDETADMKDGVWDRHLRPALSTPGRPGSAWIYGVPRPGAQFRKLRDLALDPAEPEYEYFHWTSDTVVEASEVEAARRSMDPLTFEQEYLAKRVNFAGRAYYQFDRATHAARGLSYDRSAPLILTLDFNWKPGTACVLQELPIQLPGDAHPRRVSCVLDEVWIPTDSTTPKVCRAILDRWGHHRGEVYCYGDASGGQSGSAHVEGSDWELVRRVLGAHWGDRLHIRVPRRNPGQRARINSLNSRLCSMAGTVSMLIDPKCKHVIDDFEGVVLLEGSAGEINKDHDEMLTHLTDGLGYYTHYEYPIEDAGVSVYQV